MGLALSIFVCHLTRKDSKPTGWWGTLHRLCTKASPHSLQSVPSSSMFPLWFLFASRSSSCTIPFMENARDDIEVLDDLELDASAPATKRSHREAPSDEERQQMHASFNDRISYLCKMAALVVARASAWRSVMPCAFICST